MDALKDRRLWARIAAVIVVGLIVGLVRDCTSGSSEAPNGRESTNLERVQWSGRLTADGTLAVTVEYEFLPEAFELDPDTQPARLSIPEGAKEVRLNEKAVEQGTINGVAPVATEDLVNVVDYEVPDAARLVDGQVLIDTLVVSRLAWAQNNYGYADLDGLLLTEPDAVSASELSESMVQVPGAREVQLTGETRVQFSGQVSTYDEAALVAVLPADVAPELAEDGSADGRDATELFEQAVAQRSPGRVPDGAPDPGFQLRLGQVGAAAGFVGGLALLYALGYTLEKRRRRT